MGEKEDWKACGGSVPEDPSVWVSIADLQQSAFQCQSGGCKLLLQAISKCYPDASTADTLLPWWSATVFSISDRRLFELYFTEGERHPIWPAILRSAHHQDLTSHDSLAFVRDHLAVCLDTHHSCRIPPGQQAYMPTRVLDVGIVDDGTLDIASRAPVHLVEATEIIGDRTYACLSHRWSTSGQNIITEKATYQKHKTGIEFQNLDLAYQDTVHIIRRLRVRYLWIDSLCIIQDDNEDWEAESKMMAMVYNRALFTLARHLGSNTSLTCTGNQKHLVGESITPLVYARLPIEHIWDRSGHGKVNYTSPLLKRGWIYQERLLSPRVIHFSDREISWECQSVCICQCKHREPRALAPEYSPKLYHSEALGFGDHVMTPDKAAIGRRWREMVYEYSPLDLTKLSDRLPAIQGCAEQIHAQLKGAEQINAQLEDSYLFGLWKHCLISDVAWQTEPYDEGQRPPELFYVPTWSWASVCVGVNYFHSYEGILRAQARLVLAHDDPCGRHTSTYLLVTAPTLPAQLKLGRRKLGSAYYWNEDGKEIRLHDDHLKYGSTSTSLLGPHYDFKQDFRLQAADWESETWYNIVIVRLGRVAFETVCLVLWRYGRGIPGTGTERETKDKYPIYQRIGMLNTEPYAKYHVGYEETGKAILDWSRAEEVTLAIE